MATKEIPVYGGGDDHTMKQDEVWGESTTDMFADLSLTENEKELSDKYLKERTIAVDWFTTWTESDQVDFVKTLINRMCHDQHGQIDSFLKPILQRDFISLLPELDFEEAAIERLRDSVESLETQHHFYRNLYPRIYNDIESLKANWNNGRHVLSRITCHSEPSRGIFFIRFASSSDNRKKKEKMWSGKSDKINNSNSNNNIICQEDCCHCGFSSKDRSIAVWDMVSPREINVRRVLVAHRAAVNVVDFDHKYIVSASGDRTIKVWSTDSCEFVRTLIGHRRGIACLQYHDRLVVSGSSDNTIR
ncbi:unnamed protein product [Anisakis simplex]|uniref:LD08669p (inferred by orthology to a D. melanogaster protein) n=1 Tax=Anisakis simplex TaxID=6269 RepID=A0A0M3K868_ANISI|nr:unnamed protein product [Anisakis simplex]